MINQTELLIKEWKIRFKETDIIDEKNYPFSDSNNEHKGNAVSRIINRDIYKLGIEINPGGTDFIRTNNGIIYAKTNNIITWATAKITKKPEKWVVERDWNHPRWKEIKQYIDKLFDDELIFVYNYYGNKFPHYSESLISFENHQYLTLDQFAELFLDGIKKGDWCWFWNEDSEDIVISKYDSYYVCPNRGEISYMDVNFFHWDFCEKLPNELQEGLYSNKPIKKV